MRRPHFYFDMFLTSTIPQLAYLTAALLLGWWLVRRQTGSNRLLAGAFLLWLAIPLAGTADAFEELSVAPFVIVRYGRHLLLHISPALAYRSANVEWTFFKIGLTHFGLYANDPRAGLIGSAFYNAVLLGIVMMLLLVVRPLVPEAAQDRLRGWLPERLRPLWANSWPAPGAPRRLWDINLCIILLCLAPALLAGPLTAIYLRARASHLLWPATWIAALWSLSGLIAEGTKQAMFAIADSKALSATLNSSSVGPFVVALERVLGFRLFYLMPALVAGFVLAFVCCATVPSLRATRWRWVVMGALLVSTLCFALFWFHGLPDQVRGSALLTLEDLLQSLPQR